MGGSVERLHPGPELIERLHRLAGWQYFNVADLRGVQRVKFSNGQESFELDDVNVIKPLVAGLRQSIYIGPTKCPFDHNRIDFFCSDGVVHGVVAGDGCSTILLNGNVTIWDRKPTPCCGSWSRNGDCAWPSSQKER